MAANATVPNSFTNGNATDAVTMNANFTTLLAWINANAVHLDASKAFTGVPSGPATDPTTANHLTRKSFVDAIVWGSANIANGAVLAAQLATNSVTTIKITDLNVTTAKIADLAVTTAKINDLGVTTGKLADAAVTTAKITDANVTTAKIADVNVTNAKLAVGNYASIKNSFLDDLCGIITPSAAQSIPTGVATAVTFDAADTLDPSGMHNPGVNPSRVTIATVGSYRFDCSAGFAANNTGGRVLSIVRYNSGGTIQSYLAVCAQDAGDSSTVVTLACSGMDTFAVGDYVQVLLTQDTGAGLNTVHLGANQPCPRLSWTCVRV